MKNFLKVLGIDSIFTLVDISIIVAFIKALKVTDVPSILLSIACFVLSVTVQYLLAKRLSSLLPFRLGKFRSKTYTYDSDEYDDEEED